jgi:SAM-dependent methyltransferase
MNEEPVIWHYGLMAERWAETINETPELSFFEKEIRRFGQPVLDVACGTGRLLLPLLRAGIDIDGCDISGDMLNHCRQKAIHDGFRPHLEEQPMHAFDMPRRYKTIYICGSFGLAGSREKDAATLRCCYEHLNNGGALLLNIQAEYNSPESWSMWLPEHRRNLPQPWPKEGKKRIAADGSENIAYFRTVELDPLEQCFTRQVQLEKRVDGETIDSEEYTLRGNIYFKNEIVLMLNLAGFSQITVRGDYSDAFATAKHEELIFTAIK